MNNSLILNDILESLGLSASASLIGVGIVFLVLALIIGSVMLLNLVLNILENKKSKALKVKVQEVQESKKVEPVVEIVGVSEDDKKRIVAVITAAIMVSAFDKPNARFIVRKIKKV